MTKYSPEYSPAAPVESITLVNEESLKTIRNVQVLLDTGSDITLLPISVCRELGIDVEPNATIQLESFDGSTSIGFYVRLIVQFGGKQFRGNFVAYDHPEGILGRNVLNSFRLLLDGPNLEWDFVKA
jgi:hypothetical protein